MSLVGWRPSQAGPINHMLKGPAGEGGTAGHGVSGTGAECHPEAVDCSLVFSRGFLCKAGHLHYLCCSTFGTTS